MVGTGSDIPLSVSLEIYTGNFFGEHLVTLLKKMEPKMLVLWLETARFRVPACLSGQGQGGNSLCPVVSLMEYLNYPDYGDVDGDNADQPCNVCRFFRPAKHRIFGRVY